jgi:hypothetical protein
MTDFAVAFHPIALPKPAAAAALGMSVDSFERYVQADVRCIRRGRMRLFGVAELERWAGENAERLLAEATIGHSDSRTTKRIYGHRQYATIRRQAQRLPRREHYGSGFSDSVSRNDESPGFPGHS